MKTELCKCNNCNSIMYDENPQVGATKIDVTTIDIEILPMELLNEGGDSFWGCGNCQTDAYLTDINQVEDFKN